LIQRILVIGTGFLGQQILLDATDFKKDVLGTSLSSTNNMMKLDIRKIDSISNCISEFEPDMIINCAANVNVDFLENNSELAFSINADGAKNVAITARKKGIRLVHISTDGVFDGQQGMYSENDLPKPINIYGKSKLLGEKFIQENMENYIILRTNFYGINQTKVGLLNWIIEKLSKKQRIVGFDNIIFNPLDVSELSKLIIQIGQSNSTGIMHLSSDDVISKYEFAKKVADIFNLNKNLITKGTSHDIDLIAPRPQNTSLSNKKLQKTLNPKIRSLEQCLITIKNSFEANYKDD
jgi:dTDP-4-dehydrorhamnose reductase